MIKIDLDKCKGCNLCVKNCPLDAIKVVDRKAITNDNCVTCGICVRVCPFGAINKVEEKVEGYITCTHCPVNCYVPPNKTGACTRYTNINGELVRNRKLEVEATNLKKPVDNLLQKPLITATGCGTNYPCSRPAPYIVSENVENVDVVTVVTEAPLSYSGCKVKIDTNTHIGDEGAKVKRNGRVVGMVTTEEYGSKMLTIGGASLLSGSNDGFLVAKTIVDLCNGRKVTLTIDGGSKIEVQNGQIPIIDGKEEKLMRVGCGSATIGMFARHLSKVVREAIILDFHVIGLLSEHLAGAEVGMKYSGIVPYGRKSTRGRYFGKHGHGWGGTEITNPVDAVVSVDMNITKENDRILVTETTGQKAALLEVQSDGTVKEIPMVEEVLDVVKLVSNTCEQSITSIVYTGGTGGSARAGVTTLPKKLTDAIHNNDVHLSIAGAPAFVLPGGGINFMVDVSQMVSEPLTWVPTPATVAPVEYTMTLEKFNEIGGHKEEIISKEELLRRLNEK